MVEVGHDGVELDGYLSVLLQIAASELGVLLAERQGLPGFERRLVVQTLRVTAPPPGLEEQQQDEDEEVPQSAGP